MPPRRAEAISEAIAARARWLSWYCLRLQRHGISRNDLNQVYSGAYASFFTYLENNLESLFLGVLTGRFVHARPGVRALATFDSAIVARKVVFGGRRYADWLPWSLTRERADMFFDEGRPFKDAPAADTQMLDRMAVLRNALAHQSDFALRRFHETFVYGQNLPTDQQKPAGYLRGLHAAGQTRLNFLFSQAAQTMYRLCS